MEGNLITCVGPSCSAEPGAAGATVIVTNGIVLPGMIDAHNHGLFNIFDETDWTPLQFFGDHNDWTAEQRYQQMVDAKQYLGGEGGSPVDYRCEMDKVAEIKALIAGTTSFLLAPGTTRSCYASLIRTIDTPQNDLPADRIQTSISIPSNTTAQSVCNNFAAGTTDAYVVHVAEGINQTALNEFASLASRAGGCLLSPKTTIVHGAALGLPEFDTMAAHGMRLVAVIGGSPADPYGSLLAAVPAAVRLVLVDGRALYGDVQLAAAGPSSPGCEVISLCGAGKFLCVAETSTADKLNQTYAQIGSILEAVLSDYDANVLGGTSPPFSPLAPLTSCP